MFVAIGCGHCRVDFPINDAIEVSWSVVVALKCRPFDFELLNPVSDGAKGYAEILCGTRSISVMSVKGCD